MFVMPERYIVARPFTHNGVAYAVGEEFLPNEAYRARNLDALVSRKYLVPDPDPHGRKTHPKRPTPVSHPAKTRLAMQDSVPPPPTSLAVAPTSYKLHVGETVQLAVTPTPADADDTVNWTTTVPAYASIDQNGLVTAHAFGGVNAKATATQNTGVTVFSTGEVVPDSLSITPGDTSVDMFTTPTLQFTAVPVPAAPPGSSSSWKLWKSSNTAVATISSSGLVTMKSPGTTTISCESSTESSIKGSSVLTVTSSAPPVTVTLNYTQWTQPAGVGDFLLEATVAPGTALQEVTWDQQFANWATLIPGVMGPLSCAVAVNAGSTGTCEVYAISVENPTSRATCLVTEGSVAREAEAPPKPRGRGRGKR